MNTTDDILYTHAEVMAIVQIERAEAAYQALKDFTQKMTINSAHNTKSQTK
ncbi:MAG: hypothetical protein Unbinned1446contig1005_37 [Prokaryotic dsDNA virus sp.]|nr:MAG: hypothetical protein Unbinned1446contig1005_37 [Prokaryotic dsDNA virus sp.]|tara:strand:+ start:5975 stop:6127 length:153 start_codon:yes stop_codon:yes gene_type:complete